MTDVARLLLDCIRDYEALRDNAAARLKTEKRHNPPDARKVARHQRAIAYYQQQITATQNQLAALEGLAAHEGRGAGIWLTK